MAIGYRKARELYGETLKDITKSSENWINFLNCSTWMFEYSFGEQILIYAQKPNAKACATMEKWNKIKHRWVKKDSTAITLLKYENGESKLEFVFDLEDTYNRFNKQEVLWQVNLARDARELVETLETKYGDYNENDTIQSAVIFSATNLVDDNIETYFEELQDRINEKDKEMFKSIVRDSVVYSVNLRLGLKNDSYLSRMLFEKINIFADPYTTTILGTACRELTRDMIREIRTFAKNKNRIFDNIASKIYIESDKNYEEGRDINARNREETSERLLDTENRIGESNGETNRWNILESEGEISENTSNREIRILENERVADSGLERSGNGLQTDGGDNDTTNGETGESNGEIETRESTIVGTEDEQHQSNGTTTVNEENGLLLEQDFEFTQEIIDNVLMKGSGFVEGKYRIYFQFANNHSTNDNIAFLKNEYGIGGSSSVISEISEMHDSKGILLERGKDANKKSILLTWKQVEKRLKELIYQGRYLSNDERREYSRWADENNAIITEQEQISLIDNLIQESNTKTVTDFEERNQELQSIFISQEEQEAKPVLKTTLSNMINGIPPEIIDNNAVEKTIPQEKIQYVITDNNLGVGGDKERYRNNINAIKLLKELEDENRLATKEEQDILAKYVGWGGLPKAFDKDAKEWENEYNELKTLLSEEEYEMARRTVLNAFYTPPIVVSAIYKAIGNMGFKNGNILEPACGTGNFIGRLPEEMSGSNIYGVEIDEITGKIAKQLYQKSNILIQGFEKLDIPDNSYDIAIGNVPFGTSQPIDKRYEKHKFLIHDFFFAKTIDKVRPGGIIAFVTSKGTMDKANNSIRKYIAERADLIGAIRLPNNTFSRNAGTNVTSDIIFLQKREKATFDDPEWLHLGKNEDGITMNQYFIDNPQMILGKMAIKSGQHGEPETICMPFENSNLEELLNEAIPNLTAQITELEVDEVSNSDVDTSIPADLNVRNYSYTVVDGKIYFRENTRMYLQELPEGTEKRIKKLIDIRNTTRKLLDLQLNDATDEEIKSAQSTLNFQYDNFVVEFGRIASRTNKRAFEDDSSYYLMCSLETYDDKGNFLDKAPIFSKRTIKPHKDVERVTTSQDALFVSIAEKAKIDLEFMSDLIGLSKEKIIEDLKGIIFRVPNSNEYVTADEYLSGNIREKLNIAKQVAYDDKSFDINVEYLEKSLPTQLTASEITAKLGATWIPKEIMQQFMYETFDTPSYFNKYIQLNYSEITGNWNITGKTVDRGNVKTESTFGTKRVNAYKILEATLNLKTVKVYDQTEDEEGRKIRVLNKKETAIAQSKQQKVKEEFDRWIWNDTDRRDRLERIYNERFNSIKPREYDGQYIKFEGMNPDITFRKHQNNAVAHILYGGNTLLAHAVGAGKTFEMVAAGMESKRLGLSNKALYVVPNHIIEQFASEFLQLYPSANLLVASKKDFSTNYRKRFCSKIATGDYDAIIIGHSQFEKIPMSVERQEEFLREELRDIIKGIEELKAQNSEKFTIKELERTKKKVEEKLARLHDQTRKDDVITFEELGVDLMFVDEAHYFKNLYIFSKMKNVSGITQTEAQKSADLYMKCRYLNKVTNNRGVVFATGTPISNSMVELYTMQRYLQYDTLVKHGLQHFDSWASIFGEVITTLELAPEGTGYRSKTSFARFNNLPELMAMFKEVADIQTADTLKLPVPKVAQHIVEIEASDFQKEVVESLAERAQQVRDGNVDPKVDNMLKITNDGRKLALDQRFLNDMLPDDENSKISNCAKIVYNTYKKYDKDKMTQLVFCDLSTPKDLVKSQEIFASLEQNKDLDVPFLDSYTDLKCKLIKLGVPKEEIAFIHEADTEEQKKALFAKVRNGTVRILMGSTQKMGAGTNVQTRLIALCDLDCPWRPSDLEQRMGRIVRQGNMNDQVHIYRFVTKGTFDAYLYQLVEKKQMYTSQIMTSKTPMRTLEDVDVVALNYAEIKGIASGNPKIREKTELDVKIASLKLLKQDYLSNKYQLQDKLVKFYPVGISTRKDKIANMKADLKCYEESKQKYGDDFPSLIIGDKTYTEKDEAGKALLERLKTVLKEENVIIGQYRGFVLEACFKKNVLYNCHVLTISNNYQYSISLGSDSLGNLTRLENVFKGLDEEIIKSEEELQTFEQQYKNAELESKAEFQYENELKEKIIKLNEINAELGIDDSSNNVIDFDDSDEIEEKSNKREYAR